MRNKKGQFITGHKQWLGKKRSISDRLKMSEAHKKNPTRYWKGKHRTDISGKNHYNWKGGINPINDTIRKSLEFKLWHDSVFARDGYTCKRCSDKSVYLNAHHIRNFAEEITLRFAIDNGITLCKSCHNKFHNLYGRKHNTMEQLTEFLKQ